MTTEELYNKHYAELVYFATAIVSSREDAEDIVVSVFSYAYEKKLDITKAWLYITTKGRCLNNLHRNKSLKKKLIAFLRFSDDEGIVYRAANRTEVIKMLHGEIELLPFKARVIFKMMYIDGLKISEIADKLSLSHWTVAQQLKNCKVKLRAKLKWPV